MYNLMLKKIFFLFYLFIPAVSFATIGDGAGSITKDAEVLNANVVATNNSIKVNNMAGLGSYKVVALKLNGNGGEVLEYVNLTNNQVFAITWRTQNNPNFKQLLGTYFSRLEQVPTQRIGHSKIIFLNDDFILTSSGVLRNRYGRVVLPHELPNGVTLEDIK